MPLSANISEKMKTIFSWAGSIYIDHATLCISHGLGHLAAAKAASYLESQPCDLSLTLRPWVYLPILVTPKFPQFKDDNINCAVSSAGPLLGLAACYARLKIANIYNEYSRKKSLLQNIKDGFKKSCYQGHSFRLQGIVGFHALANIVALIPKSTSFKISDGCL